MVLGADQTAGLLTPNGTFFAELIAFILMILILGKYAYPRIIKAANRARGQDRGRARGRRRSPRSASLRCRSQVEQTLEEARTQARDILNRAHREATAEAEEILAKARADAEARSSVHVPRSARERDRAIQDLRAEVADMVVAASERVLGDAIDAKAHQRLIDEALTKVGDNPRHQGGPELTMERASIIARRYAEAYFALAQEAKDIPGWREQLAGVAEVLGDPR